MQSLSWPLLWNELFYQSDNPLVFNSAFFFYAFTLFFFIYAWLYQKITLRIILVSFFSLYFFYKACGQYVVFILLAAVVDYQLSHWIHRWQVQWKRKALLIVSILLNLGLLVYFKYTDFFIEIWNDWKGDSLQYLHLILPVGISFYTFENLSYTLDVYRRHFKPVDRFIDYLFFLSYFPKLMMGPIVRAADFIPQIRQKITLTQEDVAFGLFYVFTGCFKKMVISDLIYTNIVEVVFDDPTRYNGLYALTAVYGYAMVIYCDFSGYSDMAIGIARWMGFKIEVNFLAPYQSASITEFWRRWHISLSSWLRDYLYIPLGGNRKGIVRTYMHLFITMLLGGLWHGANWTFIIWGALHGIALAADKWRLSLKTTFFTLPKWASILLTFHFVVFCWVFFGPDSFEKSYIVLHQIFFNMDLTYATEFVAHYQWILVLILLAMLLHWLPLRWNDIIVQKMAQQKAWVLWLYVVTMLIAIAWGKADVPVTPIYLQF
jgi:D-alanyl-lipoteichoic acid acyltransferase DltB (MBOAT superfamily)